MEGKFIISSFLLLLIIALLPQAALAKTIKENNESYFFLQTSLMTHHWNQNPDRNNSQNLIGLEYHQPNSSLYGLSYFENSYFQPCLYLYSGRSYTIKEGTNYRFYTKLTYGIISGYDDEGGKYTALWNELGTFPAIVPSICIEYKKIAVEVSPFANAGVIINGGVKF